VQPSAQAGHAQVPVEPEPLAALHSGLQQVTEASGASAAASGDHPLRARAVGAT